MVLTDFRNGMHAIDMGIDREYFLVELQKLHDGRDIQQNPNSISAPELSIWNLTIQIPKPVLKIGDFFR